MTQETMIKFDQVNKIYENGTVGLKDISFEVPRGEFLVVVGLSGAGKSTLLRTINRMHAITSGNIEVNGQSIIHLKGKALRELRQQVGMIFQSFNLVKRSSVLRNVLSGCVSYYPTWKSVCGLFSKKDQQRAYAALKQVSMAEKIYMRADELSGGQQQRVAIARTLMQNPQIILADEPIASLDPVTTKAVMDDLKRLNQKLGITVIVNLHSVELAREYADRIIGLRAGQLVYDEPIANVTTEALEQVYQTEQEA
ncbi:phosphate phosphonate ABC transporter ATPase [Lactobacillus selangorensis]|uniref:Phosphate phosphonate ABC transporter ATPase n=1 Tax=Lactobacillus selangorensis TaxID=81857 RepID=A0A0R2FUJ0_9LACO|nr:phosphonate ABC transporter ATP-binding protein [Lactobacillus selangorensis]KRN28892.1 phosphate phosphonate ABC transporter ATPase [Lactobacillus selangorensis]KRN32698.1 phosphate phosphonate ABC transporter ATPase [Lactobacillus selangorensis]